MKKLLSICLALLMMFSLVSCGVDTSNMKAPADGTTASEDQTAVQEDSAPESAGDVTIEETVLLEEAGVKITAKSFDAGGVFGPEVKLLIENESGQNLTVQADKTSVNGYMVDTMLSADVASGKKANDSLTFARSDMDLSGITTVADMEFSFHIFDSDSWDDYLNTDSITLTTSAAEGFSYSYDDSGSLLYDDNGVKLVAKGLAEEGSILGQCLILYIENTGDRDVTVQTDHASVNGFMVDPLFSRDVCAGKHAVAAVTIMSSELEDNAIEEITDVELTFHIFDSDSWDTIVDTDPVSVHF